MGRSNRPSNDQYSDALNLNNQDCDDSWDNTEEDIMILAYKEANEILSTAMKIILAMAILVWSFLIWAWFKI